MSFTVHSVQTLKRASKITRIFHPALTDNAYSRQYSEMAQARLALQQFLMLAKAAPQRERIKLSK
jgi:hypothetical protein